MCVGFKKKKIEANSWTIRALCFWLAASCFINLERDVGEPTSYSLCPKPGCVGVGGGGHGTSLDQLPYPSAAGPLRDLRPERCAQSLYCGFTAAGVNGSGKINPSLPQH